MYDPEKYPILETITRIEHEEVIKRDFEGAIAEAGYLYENKLHDFYLPNLLCSAEFTSRYPETNEKVFRN